MTPDDPTEEDEDRAYETLAVRALDARERWWLGRKSSEPREGPQGHERQR